MGRLRDKLLSPEFWVHWTALLGISGLVCVLVGYLTESRALIYTGVSLGAPLVLVSFIAVFVIIPLLILDNRKHRE